MKVVPYKDSNKSKKAQVSEMFDGISKEYDRMNRLITFGVDLQWRKRLINAVLALKPQRILDVATGTGDLAIALAQQSDAQVTGLDLSSGMLNVGKNKVKHHRLQDRVDMVLGDSESLPFDSNDFDAVTVAFGVRNFESLSKGKDVTEIAQDYDISESSVYVYKKRVLNTLQKEILKLERDLG